METIRQLVGAGFTPGSAVDAFVSEDLDLLVHPGRFPVHLPPPAEPRTPTPGQES